MTWDQAKARLAKGAFMKRPDWDCFILLRRDGEIITRYPNGRETQYRSYRYAERADDWIEAQP